jgi:hypothetical protein
MITVTFCNYCRISLFLRKNTLITIGSWAVVQFVIFNFAADYIFVEIRTRDKTDCSTLDWFNTLLMKATMTTDDSPIFSKESSTSCPWNIRLGWKWLTLTNILSYSKTWTNESVIFRRAGANVIKLFHPSLTNFRTKLEYRPGYKSLPGTYL